MSGIFALFEPSAPTLPGIQAGVETFDFLAWRFISFGRWLRRFEAAI
jgi:hypothetical protein